MNNGAKPSKLEISIESFPYYSSYYEKAGVSPVMRVNVSGFPENTCSKLEISIVGKCGDTEFIHRHDFVRMAFSPESYNYKQKDSCVFEYNFGMFSFNTLFLSSIEKEIDAEIYVMVSYGDTVCCEKNIIRLLPRNYWQGLEYEPCSLSSFVLPYEEHIEEICKGIGENMYADYIKCDKKQLSEGIKAIYKALKAKNIIYSRPAGYGASLSQRIRLPEELFTGSSTLATPLEIALLFSSCASRCGYDTEIIFGVGRTTEVRILCGIWRKKSTVSSRVFENKEHLCDAVMYGELVVVEPSVFAAAQNTSFSLACESARNMFLNSAFSLICSIDVNKCFEYGVLPLIGKSVLDINEHSQNPKIMFSKLYTSLRSMPCMKMMTGEQTGRFPEIPLLCDFDDVFFDGENKRMLLPIDINISLYEFAGLDKGFSSVVTSSHEAKKHSKSERDIVLSRLERIRSKILSKDSVMTVLNEENLYETACKMVFGKDKALPYTVFGYIRIYDKLTDISTFAPVCLVPTKVSYNNGSFYFCQNGKPIVNKLFIRNALRNAAISYDSFLSSIMPDDKNEIFELFNNVKSALAETDDRYTYDIIREAHIIYADLSDYMLWNDMSVVGRKIIDNQMAGAALGVSSDVEISKENHKSNIAATVSSKGVSNAINESGDIVVTGKFADDKKRVLSGIVNKEITSGKTILIACTDDSAVKFVNRVLDDNNLNECYLNVDDNVSPVSVAQETAAILDKYKDINQSNIADIPKDLPSVNQKLCDYESKLNKEHSLGMSVRNALKMYCEANEGMSDVSPLYVNEKYFENIDEKSLELLFDDAAKLIVLVKRLCKVTGIEYHTPLKEHPLYGTRPAELKNEDDYNRIHELIESVYGTLSEYRDLFYDVSGILGIDINEINTLNSLVKLNELYDLCILSKDLEISEEFLNSDIEGFVESINRSLSVALRCDEIKHELNFFQNEIFEDIDILLAGDKYDENEKGILKKFMHKKNNQETLLQYVSPENRLAFSSKNVAEIYKLLYEYKGYIIESKNQPILFDESLADTALKATAIIDEITGENSFDRGRRISNVFRLISIIPVDSTLARKLTVAKAKLCELVSEKGAIAVLEKLLGADFSSLSFSEGILSFDGISSHLRKIENKLDIKEKWIKWLDESENIRNNLPSFVKYIEEHGIKKNTERLFAKSLLLPVFNKIVSDTFDYGELENIGVSKDKYVELLLRANELSAYNCKTAYTQSVRHCAETTSVPEFLEGSNVLLRDFFTNNKPLMSKIKPCIVAKADSLINCLGKNCEFDTVIVIDDESGKYRLLPALSFGKRCVMIDMSCDNSSVLSNSTVRHGIKRVDTGNIVEEASSSLLTWLNSCVYDEQLALANLTDSCKVELVRINGIYDRTEKIINKTEAELAVSKAAEALVSNRNAVITITAFSHEQCEAIERIAYTMKKKNQLIYEAIADGQLTVYPINDLYKTECTNLIVSACFCSDKNGRTGWSLEDASSHRFNSASSAYTYLCENHASQICIISGMSAPQAYSLRKKSVDIRYFNSLCEFLYDGRIPASALQNDAEIENNVATSLISTVGTDKTKMTLCTGKYAYGASLYNKDKGLLVFIDNDKNVSLHDELLLKHFASNKTSVLSVSPASFAQESGKVLIDDLLINRHEREVQ